MFTLYNTLTRKKEEFIPIKEGKVLLYHCGPTVYWTQHIGNLRGMTMGDLIVRTLRFEGFDVTHVRNYTDVGHMTSDEDTGEDKMEKGVKREGLSVGQIASKYIRQFEEDTDRLNLTKPTYTPRATEYIQEMIAMVSDLLSKGFAYTTKLAVYFDVSKFDRYTELSHQKIDFQNSGAGNAEVSDPEKRNSADFALWFFQTGTHQHAIQVWPSPFPTSIPDGYGFPGWHIECSAMARKLLGKTIDIHIGGIEHIPVHHTNEIAQSECANGQPFVHYWLHNGHLVVNEKKMAKSEGTGMSLTEIIEKGFDPMALRYFFLQAHYRSEQNFTYEGLAASQKALTDLRSLVRQWKNDTGRTELSEEKADKIDEFIQAFRASLENDFNIPKALAITWEAAKSSLPSEDKYDLLVNFDAVLGLRLADSANSPEENVEIPSDVKTLIETRDRMRATKDFVGSDRVRKDLEKLGYSVEDTPEGTRVKKV